LRGLADAEVPPELAQHALRCPRCRGLWQLERAMDRARCWPHRSHAAAATRRLMPAALRPRSPPMAAELAELLADHRPTLRRLPCHFSRSCALLLVVAASVLATYLGLPRTDLHQVSVDLMLRPFALLFTALLVGVQLFLFRGRSGLGVPPAFRWAFTVGAGGLFAVLVALEISGAFGQTSGLRPARDCLFVGSFVAFAVYAAAIALGRRTALIGPAASGALVGSIAGLAAMLCLHLHCPSANALHLGIVHTLPMLGAIGVGAAVGRKRLAA
jgi:hypothetical protein